MHVDVAVLCLPPPGFSQLSILVGINNVSLRHHEQSSEEATSLLQNTSLSHNTSLTQNTLLTQNTSLSPLLTASICTSLVMTTNSE